MRVQSPTEWYPANRLATVATHVASLGMAAPPRTASEVLETLASAGMDRELVTRLTDPTTDGWAKILARGGTFTWEVWEPSDVNGDSMSHGWGADVLVAIQRAILGVSPTVPGFRSFEVAPPRAGPAWATGTVPTPCGTVAVAWRRDAGSGRVFTLDLSVPPNSGATVRLPAASAAAVTEGGRAVNRAVGVRTLAQGGGATVLGVGSGQYRFRCAPTLT